MIKHAGGWGVIVITGKQFTYRDLPSNLISRLEVFLQDIISNTFWTNDFYSERLQAMYRLIIKPIEDLIPAAGRLVLAPAGALNLIPFNALMD